MSNYKLYTVSETAQEIIYSGFFFPNKSSANFLVSLVKLVAWNSKGRILFISKMLIMVYFWPRLTKIFAKLLFGKKPPNVCYMNNVYLDMACFYLIPSWVMTFKAWGNKFVLVASLARVTDVGTTYLKCMILCSQLMVLCDYGHLSFLSKQIICWLRYWQYEKILSTQRERMLEKTAELTLDCSLVQNDVFIGP